MRDTDPHINTVSGRRVPLLDPDPADIALVDIAHGLSHICRFAGQSDSFYSVAKHSLNVSRALATVHDASPERQLYGLLHDASEAYLADVPGPAKPHFEDYGAAEAAVMDAVWSWSGLGDPATRLDDPQPWTPVDRATFECEADVLVAGYEADPDVVATYEEYVDTSPAGDFEAIEEAFVERALELGATADASLSLDG